MRGFVYASIGLMQGFGLGVAHVNGRWEIYILLLVSIIVMLAYVVGDGIARLAEQGFTYNDVL
jgi:hypothetical protein